MIWGQGRSSLTRKQKSVNHIKKNKFDQIKLRSFLLITRKTKT